ncbi:MAG: hypothetical protein GY679_03055 [Mycoplasma sp.]|nr:hypothetical protein [Mycoplasma sp.]
MKIKKFIPILTASLIISPIILTTACGSVKKTRQIASTTAAEDFLNGNAWTSFIMANPSPEGATLDIPEMSSLEVDLKPTAKELHYNPKAKTKHLNIKESNKDAFEKVPVKVYDFNYQKLTKKSNSQEEAGFILKKEFLRINKEIKAFLVSKPKNKYAAYFSKNSTNLKIEIKKLKPVTQEGIKKVKDHFVEESDLNDASFPEFKGHAFWQREAMIRKFDFGPERNESKKWETRFDMKFNLDSFFGGPNKSYVPLNNGPFLDNKIRLRDNSSEFTLDPRKYSGSSNAKEQKKWLDDKYKKLFYDNETNINSYPYLNMQTNELNIMLIFSDKDAEIKTFKLDPIGNPSITYNAKQLDYKVIKIKNFLPTTNKQIQITKAQKKDTLNLIKAAILWLEKFGGPDLFGWSIELMRNAIPNVQSVIEPILPLLEAWKKQELKFKEKEKISDFDNIDVQKLDIWKNIELKSENIFKQFENKNFDFSQTTQLAKNIFKTKKSTENSKEIIDKENSNFWNWNQKWVTELNGRNSNYLLKMLFILNCATKGLV